MAHVSVVPSTPAPRDGRPSKIASKNEQDRYYEEVMEEARKVVETSLPARRRSLNKRPRRRRALWI